MHHIALNIPDLLIGLWRATLYCDKDNGDSIDTWKWAVLRGDMWKAHGKTVADATPYLPAIFDRPPRNPADKINSGYKAIEYLNWLFVLGPGLLYHVLPEPYFSHFCMLTCAIRKLHSRSISPDALRDSQSMLLTFVTNFENIYYEQRTARIHFMRQSIHSLTHLAREIHLLGPAGLYSQWTMERTIGNLGQEIRQPSNPYSNLSERAVIRAQLNAVKALIPGLGGPAPAPNRLVQRAHDLGRGYSFRRARDEIAQAMPSSHADALRDYLEQHRVTSATGLHPLRVQRWARLALPNGHVCRSAWKEETKAHGSGLRIARNIVHSTRGVFIAEVLYYFLHHVVGTSEPIPFAMVRRYSRPDAAILSHTYGTLAVSTLEKTKMHAVQIKDIRSVVGMVPLPKFDARSGLPYTRSREGQRFAWRAVG
ncbi:hypothetical protein EV714DRAFT_220906 [Schizophyllum commune]